MAGTTGISLGRKPAPYKEKVEAAADTQQLLNLNFR